MAERLSGELPDASNGIGAAIKRKDDMSSIVGLMFLSTIAIGLFYGAGLMWGEQIWNWYMLG